MQDFIGKKVIVRGHGSGVFFGTLAAKEKREVKLTNCRRIWSWEGAASLSQIAIEGVKNPEICHFTMTVDEIIIMDAVEIIPCTEIAIKNIEEVPIWKI